MSSTDVHCVGDVDDPNAHVVRIIHISDTHELHDNFIAEKLIPDGDILVHSGDFGKYHISRLISKESDYRSEVEALKAFFSGMWHLT